MTNRIARKPFVGISSLILALSIAGASASTLDTKTDGFVRTHLAKGKTHGWTQVIVKLQGKLTTAQSEQLTSLKADVYRHLDLIDSLAISVPNRNLRQLAGLSFVKRLSGDATMRKNDEQTVERSGAAAAFADNGLTGAGVTVAVLDSGIGQHDDLSGRVIASVNFSNSLLKDANDLFGHGTHVAGIIAGNGASSTGSSYTRTFYGVARKANLVNVRVLDALGSTNVSSVIAGVQWCIANKAKYGIRIMNLSMGHPVGESYQTDPLCQAVEEAWRQGIVVVCSAGNDGRASGVATSGKDNDGYGTAYGSIGSPGNDPYVITVGAMRSMDSNRAHDQIATYSSRGPSRLDFVLKPDIVAPGNQIVSLRKPLGLIELTNPGSVVPLSQYKKGLNLLQSSAYLKLSGTSMATPVVSGAAALLLEANPSLTPDTIKARLMFSADKWTDPNGNGDACSFGAGYLNIPAALRSTLTVSQFSLSPTLVREVDGSVRLPNDNSIWSNQAIWGVKTGGTPQALWGNGAFGGGDKSAPGSMKNAQALWGNSVWGDSFLFGNNLIKIDLGIILLNGE